MFVVFGTNVRAKSQINVKGNITKVNLYGTQEFIRVFWVEYI